MARGKPTARTHPSTSTNGRPDASPSDLVWRSQPTAPRSQPLESWDQLILLLLTMGADDNPYLVVESPRTKRFTQSMGDPDAMIVEVCADGGSPRPLIWRLSRPVALPHGDLGAMLFDNGNVTGKELFTAVEAGSIIRGWLTHGGVASDLALTEVSY